MIPFLQAIFTQWEFRPEVLVLPLFFILLYGRGWLHLYRLTSAREAAGARAFTSDRKRLASPWRLAAYLAGWGVLLLSLLSGLDAYASMLFFVHMIQHLLQIMVAPILLWLGNPFPFVMWGLPHGMRKPVGRLLSAPSPFRQALQKGTSLGIAWMVLVAVVWIWHDGQAYNLTLRSQSVHDFEHITFFLAGMLFWWRAIGAGPVIHAPLSYWRRAIYVLAAIPPNAALGAAIALSSRPLYTYYESVPRLWGISVMNDQMLSGVIMWVPGSMMYLMAVLVMVALHFRGEERKAPLPYAEWTGGEALLAPGLEERDRAVQQEQGA